MLAAGQASFAIAPVRSNPRKQQPGDHHGHGPVHPVLTKEIDGHKFSRFRAACSVQVTASSGHLHCMDGFPHDLQL